MMKRCGNNFYIGILLRLLAKMLLGVQISEFLFCDKYMATSSQHTQEIQLRREKSRRRQLVLLERHDLNMLRGSQDMPVLMVLDGSLPSYHHFLLVITFFLSSLISCHHFKGMADLWATAALRTVSTHRRYSDCCLEA